MRPESVARSYYRAIDDHDYETFADLLAPDVVHRRPDRTIEGRGTLVAFMRDERPRTDTSHELERVSADGDTAVVEGTLLDSDGNALFEFEDEFSFADDRITNIRTRTR